jgi:hypothetical protein
LRHTLKDSLRQVIDGKVFHSLAADHPAVFNAYQQTQPELVENRMKKASYVASFIGHEPGYALFIGLYQRHGQKRKTPSQIRSEPAVQQLEMFGFPPEKVSRLWFDLRLREDFFGQWKGKLVVKWPGKERSWHRFVVPSNLFKISAIHAESLLEQKVLNSYRKWDKQWNQLKLLSDSEREKLNGWRGIYYIFDVSDGKGYVGKASGKENLLGRWMDYAKTGHGGNVKLRGRDPSNFRFSILELIPWDLEEGEVEEIEKGWMLRLRTRTHGLN